MAHLTNDVQREGHSCNVTTVYRRILGSLGIWWRPPIDLSNQVQKYLQYKKWIELSFSIGIYSDKVELASWTPIFALADVSMKVQLLKWRARFKPCMVNKIVFIFQLGSGLISWMRGVRLPDLFPQLSRLPSRICFQQEPLVRHLCPKNNSLELQSQTNLTVCFYHSESKFSEIWFK